MKRRILMGTLLLGAVAGISLGALRLSCWQRADRASTHQPRSARVAFERRVAAVCAEAALAVQSAAQRPTGR